MALKFILLFIAVTNCKSKIFLCGENPDFISKFSEFPSWEPDSNEVLCAKFLYFYEIRCFNPFIEKLAEKINRLRGFKRLQGTYSTGQIKLLSFKAIYLLPHKFEGQYLLSMFIDGFSRYGAHLKASLLIFELLTFSELLHS